MVVQENRSFNNLFIGYPGAHTVPSGRDHSGHVIPLHPVEFQNGSDMLHSLAAFLSACDGIGSFPGTDCKMDGFDLETPGAPHEPYAYVPSSQTQPYREIAEQYVLDDMMFPSQLDGSFTAHQYLIAAQAGSAVNFPNSFWGCNGGPSDLVETLGPQRTITGTEPPCFDYLTLADEIDNAQPPLTWRFYAPGIGPKCLDTNPPKTETGGYWSAYRAVAHICNGPDWQKDVISPQTQFLSDVPAGILSSVTWIVPSLADSDHPGSKSSDGPSWVTSIVNTIGESRFWSSTAIIVVWDDWGGLYDPVPPPYRDYDGNGIRVPALCISPYSYRGKVDSNAYEFGGIDALIEDTFNLGRLSAADTRATDVGAGCINPNQRVPRRFTPISAPQPSAHFMRERRSADPPDSDF